MSQLSKCQRYIKLESKCSKPLRKILYFSNFLCLCKLDYDENFEECPLFYDEVLCWPPTPVNSTHSIPCTIALQTLLNEYHVISEDGKFIFWGRYRK